MKYYQHIKNPFYCVSYNKPPNSNVSWYQHFDKELTNGFAKNYHVLITGDINRDYLKPLPSNWKLFLSTYDLDQLVHNPTLVTSKSVTLIDHIYTSRPEEVMQVRVSTY